MLAVSPTHREAELMTVGIRQKLRENGLLKSAGQKIPVFKSRNLTTAQRQLARFLRVGDLVRFHRNIKGRFRKGDVFEITRLDDKIWIKRNDQKAEEPLPIERAQRYEVLFREDIEISVGDQVRLNKNYTTKSGRKLFNGSIRKVIGFTAAGNLRLENGTIIDRRAGVLDHGYVSTSHASQGKTAGKVIISQSALSHPASSLEQFYVSASRGRKKIAIFTDDKADLLENIRQSATRMLATELAPPSRESEQELEIIQAHHAQIEHGLEATR